MKYDIHTDDMKRITPTLRAGDTVFITGVIYTARDAAHLRLIALLEKGEPLPFPLDGATIYYAGPTPARPGEPIGSCGPTTASRMDKLCLPLLDRGLSCMIGKGERNAGVAQSIEKNGAVYIAAVGGAGALIASCIHAVEVVAFDDLGCESVKRLTVVNFPGIVAQDASGGNLYKSAQEGIA